MAKHAKLLEDRCARTGALKAPRNAIPTTGARAHPHAANMPEDEPPVDGLEDGPIKKEETRWRAQQKGRPEPPFRIVEKNAPFVQRLEN
jgi:hypothetical protein